MRERRTDFARNFSFEQHHYVEQSHTHTNQARATTSKINFERRRRQSSLKLPRKKRRSAPSAHLERSSRRLQTSAAAASGADRKHRTRPPASYRTARMQSTRESRFHFLMKRSNFARMAQERMGVRPAGRSSGISHMRRATTSVCPIDCVTSH